jgi:DNA-binding transcriptional LysR family regulator
VELEDIALYLTVVRCGSMTRAAATAGFSQSTVSRRLQRLELEVGRTLLDRSAVPVVPTQAGAQFAEFAEDVVRQWEALQKTLGRAEELAGELRIAASSAPAAQEVPQILALFVRAYPRVHTRLMVMSSQDVEAAVATHRVQAGFTGARPHDCCLWAVPVAEDEVRLVVPDDGRFRALADPVPLTVLATLPFIQREEGSATLDIVRQALVGAGHSGRLTVKLEVDSAEAAINAVAAGIGATFVSTATLARFHHLPIRTLAVEGVQIHRPLYFVGDPVTMARDPVAAIFRDFVAARDGYPEDGEVLAPMHPPQL